MAVGDNTKARAEFVLAAINDHKASKQYQEAKDNQLYYEGLNPKINRYFKIVYDALGKAHKNVFAANHKIASNFFGFSVDQEVSFLLRNGIRFSKDETKKKLGKDFDQRAAEWLTSAACAGTSFAFVNLDHIEIFHFVDDEKYPGFAPLYDEEDGTLKAGIRYWQLSEEKPLRATLYELEGVTEFMRPKDGEIQLKDGTQERQPYVIKKTVSAMDGETVEPGESYPGFPIIPMYYNRKGNSAMTGKRATIDALDLVTSNLVNDVDEGNLVYWVLTNCDGMSELDDINFWRQLISTKVVHANGSDGAKAEPKTVEAPFAGTEAAIDTLTKRLYTIFQAFDSSAVSAGNQTATAIQASYVPLDLKCDKIEAQVTDAILKVLELLGIDDEPMYERNYLINKTEETERILLGAEHYDDEYITKKLLAIGGDLDQLDEMMKRKELEESSRYKQMESELDDMKKQQKSPAEPEDEE